MNKEQKAYSRKWEHNLRFTSVKGGSISLETIMNSERADGNRPFDESDAELFETIHPVLLFHFLVDWNKIRKSRIPKGFNSGEEFGRHVINQWLKECWEKKYYRYDIFSNYTSIDDVRANLDTILHGSITYADGYEALAESMYEMRQEYLDNEAEEERKRQEKLRQEKEKALEEERYKDAQRAADELRRRQDAEANEAQAQRNRDFLNKPSSPWSSGVVGKETVSEKQPEADVQQTTDASLKKTDVQMFYVADVINKLFATPDNPSPAVVTLSWLSADNRFNGTIQNTNDPKNPIRFEVTAEGGAGALLNAMRSKVDGMRREREEAEDKKAQQIDSIKKTIEDLARLQNEALAKLAALQQS